MQRPPPDVYQPRLRWYSHVWRTAAAVLIGGGAWATVVEQQWQEQRPLFWLDITLGVLALILMFYRRRWPFPIAIVITLFGFVSALSVGAGAVVAVSLATRRRWPELLTVGALGILVGQTFVVVQPTAGDAWWLTLGINTIATVAILAIGMYVGSRRELLWTLRERAERAEAEQELRVAQARSNERARIAREMHDVLAHRISLVTMHSGALAYRTDLSREEVARSAEIIQSSAHQALIDLRHVLGVLRGDAAEPAKDSPQPTFREVATLVDDAVASGMHVEYDAHVNDAGTMPDQVGRTVYRIVQESLTNARKHAPGALVTVSVSGDREHGVDVHVHNLLRPGAYAGTPGAGLGLVGLAERAELAGGMLEHDHDARSFTLRGWLPWGDMITVLIVDDDALVRAGLGLILGGADDIELVAEAADGKEGVDLTKQHRPDVVLMDIRMPNVNGLDATEQLQAQPDPPKVIVLTTFDTDDTVVRALAVGADGFLLKDTPPAQIVEAVRKVAGGEPMLSPSVTAQLIRQVRDGATSDRGADAQQRLAVLTDRETEVAVAVGQGWSNAEISAELHMSVPTVKAHVSRLFMKLEVHNRVQIAICVHDAGLV